MGNWKVYKELVGSIDHCDIQLKWTANILKIRGQVTLSGTQMEIIIFTVLIHNMELSRNNEVEVMYAVTIKLTNIIVEVK